LQKPASFADFFQLNRGACISIFIESGSSMLCIKALSDASGCTRDANDARILRKTATEKVQISEIRKKLPLVH
jgi:hypothetical protein